jgi:hypothetical protein
MIASRVLCTVDWGAIGTWVEAIALVLIFIWDRIDAKADHKETLKQIKLVEDQIRVSQNAERAWLMGYLEYPEIMSISLNTEGGNAGDPPYESTTVELELHVRNEGRSPAFILSVKGYCALIQGKIKDLPGSPLASDPEVKTFAPISPIAPGKYDSNLISLTCKGHKKANQWIVVVLFIEYRDIFDTTRNTHIGYAVNGNEITRLVQFAEYNSMT